MVTATKSIQAPNNCDVLPPIRLSPSSVCNSIGKDATAMDEKVEKYSEKEIKQKKKSSKEIVRKDNVGASTIKRKFSNSSLGKARGNPISSRTSVEEQKLSSTYDNDLTLTRIVSLVSSFLAQCNTVEPLIQREHTDKTHKSISGNLTVSVAASDVTKTKESNSMSTMSTLTTQLVGAIDTTQPMDREAQYSSLCPNMCIKTPSILQSPSGSSSPATSITSTSSAISAASTVNSMFQRNKIQVSKRSMERRELPAMIAIHAIDTSDKYTTTSDFEEYYSAYFSTIEKALSRLTVGNSTITRKSSRDNICIEPYSGASSNFNADGGRYIQNISSVPIPNVYKRKQSSNISMEQQQTLLRQQSMRNDRPSTVSTTTLKRVNSIRMINHP